MSSGKPSGCNAKSRKRLHAGCRTMEAILEMSPPASVGTILIGITRDSGEATPSYAESQPARNAKHLRALSYSPPMNPIW